MYYLISILLGLVPEVLFITLFVCYTKNLKQRKIKLFLMVALSYVVCMLIQQYRIYFYFLFMFLLYLSLKMFEPKNTQIIDFFVINIPFLWISILSYLCFLFLKQDLSNYYLLYFLDRIVLFIPLIFKNRFNNVYKKYCTLWNRNDKEKRKIKSITLRNISLICINVAICFMNIYAISIINFMK